MMKKRWEEMRRKSPSPVTSVERKRGEMKRGALVIACGEAGLAVIVKEHDFPSNPISSTFGSPRVFGTWTMLAMAL